MLGLLCNSVVCFYRGHNLTVRTIDTVARQRGDMLRQAQGKTKTRHCSVSCVLFQQRIPEYLLTVAMLERVVLGLFLVLRIEKLRTREIGLEQR